MGIDLILDMAAGAHGDRVALGRRAGGLSFADLDRAAAGGAGVLRASGAGSIAYIGLNGPVLPALMFAATRAGIPLTPLNYRLSAGQLRALLAELDRPYVVADQAFMPAVAAAAPSEEWLDLALASEPVAPAQVDDSAPAVVLFTSGTTSKPKAVVLRHSHLLSYVLETVEFGSADAEDAVLVSVPPYHIAGVGSVLSNLYAGRRMTYLPDFHPGEWLQLVQHDRVTHAMVVPTMLARIVLKKGAHVPTHHHMHEQISHVVDGALEFRVDGNTIAVRAGGILCIPPHMPHEVVAIEDSVALDIFNPPRQDWINGDDAYLRSGK